MEFTTLSSAPSGSPRNVVPFVTSRSIMVTWDAIECIERNGEITGYRVEFQEQGGASIPGEVIGQSFTASGLTPGRIYTFRVAGVNSNGTGPFTETSISIGEEAPGPVSALMAQATSIVLTWSSPQEPNGVIISYEVTYRVNSGNPVTTNTTDSSTTFTIPSLAPQTRVSDISVSAYTRIGRGEAVRLSLVTLEELCPCYSEEGIATSVAVSISVVVSSLLTILLYTTVLLVVGAVCRRSLNTKVASEREREVPAIYEEVDALKVGADALEMKVNAAYGPVAAPQQEGAYDM